MGPILRRCTKASRMMSNLTTKEFLEEQILCPTLEEQKFIGEFIVSLDKNITLHQQEPFLCGNSVNGGVELC